MKATPKLRARSLRIEALEKRQLLTSGITAAINSAGTLSILGTDGDDRILVRQTGGQIMIAGVNAAWMANKVKSIAITLGGGDDFVSLASQANGGNQTLSKHVTVSTGPGAAQVRLNPGHDVYLNDSGETLDYAPGAPPRVNGTTVGKLTATINLSGVLTVTGTTSDDSIRFQQSGGKIYVSGVKGSWSAASVTAIVVNPQSGTDYVSLDSIGNGGTQVLQVSVTVSSGSGADTVHLSNGHDVALSGTGHTLVVASDGTATLDGTVLTWNDPLPPPPPPPPPPPSGTTWFDTNILDGGIRTIGDQEFADGVMDRSDMINLYREVESAGAVTSTEMTDLQLIANTGTLFGNLDYVWKLTSYIVLGSTSNTHYQGSGTLGNLAIGSSAAQLEMLVDKWFLGTDHPSADYGYSLAAGTLFVNGPAYTDVHQGALSDCGTVASLAELALRSPSVISNMFIDNGDGTYTVRFYYGVAQYVTVDSYLPSSGDSFAYAHTGSSISDSGNELWVSLAEKAYVQWQQFRGGANNYHVIEYLYPYMPLGQISGFSTVGLVATSGGQSKFATSWSAGNSIVLTSYSSAPDVVGNHCYTVVGYDSASGTVTLFNPWGIEYGLVTLTWSQVVTNFQYFDHTS